MLSLLSFMIAGLVSQLPGPIEHADGVPPVAWPETPYGAGERSDDRFVLEWTDADALSPTGTVTVDWYYTAKMPRTYPLGVIPKALTGTVIVTGIDEADLTNRYEWNTSSVAAGSYFVWSLVNEPPEEMAVLRVVAFSRGVVTVAHVGDRVYPAIIFTKPDSPYFVADEDFVIQYETSDPDGTGRVKLEASSSTVGEDFVTVAEDLAAVRNGSFAWNTASLTEGDWTLRATIEDDRGLRHTAYCRFFLRVQHPLDSDAGVQMTDADQAFEDASPPMTLDSGTSQRLPDPDQASCNCRSTDGRYQQSGPFMSSLILLMMIVMRPKRLV